MGDACVSFLALSGQKVCSRFVPVRLSGMRTRGPATPTTNTTRQKRGGVKAGGEEEEPK